MLMAHDADRAFAQASRAGRRSALARRLRREAVTEEELPVFDERAVASARPLPGRGICEIPLEAIRGTLEPGRARMFDRRFRPAESARSRWQRLWRAAQLGEPLPPISVIAVDGSYVVRDGHHRVSVAMACGAVTIEAIVEAAWLPVSGRR
jgi:hypothetical protein